MKNIKICLVLFLVFGTSAFSQFNDKTGRADISKLSGTAPPMPCTEGDFYIKTDNPLGQRLGTCHSGAWEFPSGGSSVPTGTGFRKVTSGVEDGAASFPTKADVGLGNADNTSDANKPVSTATQAALDGKAAASHTHNGSDINAGTVADVRLSVNVSLLGQTVGGSELGNPAVGTKGGVESKTCSGTDKISAIGTDGVPVCSADQTSGGGLPAGAGVIIVSGTCAATLGAGWTEANLGGKFLLLTVAASADIGTTGGQDTVTAVINHTHPVTDPGHTHLTQRYPTTTGGSSGFTADTSMSGTLADNTLPTKTATTGVTTTNPAGGVASIDNRPAFVRVILCVRD